MNSSVNQIENLRKLRAAVRVLILKGKLRIPVKDVDEFNEETLTLLLREEEREKMDSLNGSLSLAFIEASIEICRKGGILKNETLDSLKKDLLENEIVTSNAKIIVGYASTYVPVFGLVAAAGFVGFYVLRNALFSEPETKPKFEKPTIPEEPKDTKLPETFHGL